MFALIKFISKTKGKTKKEQPSVVPLTWIEGDQSVWPPKHLHRQIESCLKSGQPLSKSDMWPKYKCQILGVFESYEMAAGKLKKAEAGSDLETTDPEQMGKGKRKKFLPRTYETTTTEDDEITSQSQSLLPTPPKTVDKLLDFEYDSDIVPEPSFCLNSDNMSTQKDNLNGGCSSFSDLDTQVEVAQSDTYFDATIPPFSECQEVEIQSNCTVVRKPSQKSNGGSFVSSLNLSSQIEVPENESAFISDQPRKSSQLSSAASAFPQKSGEKENFNEGAGTSLGASTKHNLNSFEQSVFRETNLLKANQNIINQQIQTMVKTLNCKQFGELNRNPNDLEEIEAFLPLRHKATFNSFDKKLEEPVFLKKVVSYMITIGGVGVSQVITNIVKSFISNELATEYSFHGFKGKIPFKKLNFFKAIKMALRRSLVSNCVTTHDVVTAISSWLRHAPQRVKYAALKK